MLFQSSEIELVALAKTGHRQAFEVLVLRYQNPLERLIRRYVVDQSLTKDILQEVLIQAFQSLSQFRGECSFGTWLYRIAANRALNHCKAPTDEQTTDPEMFNEIFFQQGQHNPLPSPEDVILCAELQGAFGQALTRLSEDLQTTYVLREMVGLSYEDIAQVMDCPLGTVRSRISRAREEILSDIPGEFHRN